MSRGRCCRNSHPPNCACGMQSLYRFVEPLALYLLQKNGKAYGYDLLSQIKKHVLTDSPIDGAGLYRTLRILEKNGHLESTWVASEGGPARRLYSLTSKGEMHLFEWRDVIYRLQKSLCRFVSEVDELKKA